MARDRQRSKQRRRRAAQGGGNPARSRAADVGLDDATLDESGLTDTAPAPDPLKNAFPDIDQVRAAEAGSVRGEPGAQRSGGEPEGRDRIDLDEDDVFAGEDDLERAPDEVQTPAGLDDGRRRRRGAVAAGDDEHLAPEVHRERGRILTFLRACVDELRRVQWPDRKHVFQATAVVLGFVLLAGGYLGLLDAIWQPLINSIL